MLHMDQSVSYNLMKIPLLLIDVVEYAVTLSRKIRKEVFGKVFGKNMKCAYCGESFTCPGRIGRWKCDIEGQKCWHDECEHSKHNHYCKRNKRIHRTIIEPGAWKDSIPHLRD